MTLETWMDKQHLNGIIDSKKIETTQPLSTAYPKCFIT